MYNIVENGKFILIKSNMKIDILTLSTQKLIHPLE